jgi:hypothetical protein
MTKSIQPREWLLLSAVAALLACAALGPAVPQAAGYHAFADQQARWGLPHAADVLSNLPFLFVALAGAWRLRVGADAASRAEAALAAVAFAGLALTACGSAWYHLQPDDAGLWVDRAAMAVAFAGLLGLAACRASHRAGVVLGAVLLLAGPAAVQAWSATGSLLPWVVLQGGGVLVLVALASMPSPGALPVRWWLVLAGYALAKLLELGDHAIWAFTGEMVSGHTLKHVVAAAAVWPVVHALGTSARHRHNRAALPVRAA